MEISLLTDVGQKRTNNQDYVNLFVNRAGRTMIILADGMGGHRAGNIASEMAVTDLGAAWVDTQIDSVNQVREWFAEHLEQENQRIHQLRKHPFCHRRRSFLLQLVPPILPKPLCRFLPTQSPVIRRSQQHFCLKNRAPFKIPRLFHKKNSLHPLLLKASL